jgi:branched-chain amino acid transport system substrate-binding protein
LCMKRLRVFSGIIATAFLVLAIGLPAAAQETNEIRIGVIGPMKYSQGTGHWNGALMAADEINARGGLQVGDKKVKIKLVKADSNEILSITDANNAMERLLTVHNVDFVVGGFHAAVPSM